MFDCLATAIEQIPPAYVSNVNVVISEKAAPYDGRFYWADKTIVIRPKVCNYPVEVIKFVVLHELGHSVAVPDGDTSEAAADYYARIWYGDVKALLAYTVPLCADGQRYYCYIGRVMAAD